MTNAKPASLLSLIRGAETSRGHDDYSRFATVAPPKAPTEMTIGEIREWQRKAIRAGSKSVAIGGYQFISKTFDGVVRDMNLSDDTIFSADVQDNMGMHLLNRRGYSKWIAGQITDSQFGDNLAMEWASLPRFTGPKRGASHYARDGLNKVQTGIDVVQQTLAADRNGKFTDFQGPVSAHQRPSRSRIGDPSGT